MDDIGEATFDLLDRCTAHQAFMKLWFGRGDDDSFAIEPTPLRADILPPTSADLQTHLPAGSRWGHLLGFRSFAGKTGPLFMLCEHERLFAMPTAARILCKLFISSSRIRRQSLIRSRAYENICVPLTALR
jgi:hypothetical protein